LNIKDILGFPSRAPLDLDSPRTLKTLSQTDDSISLEWSNSEADVGGYRVKYTPFSGGSPREELFPSAAGETTKATITGKRIMH
jgi:syndecan 4